MKRAFLIGFFVIWISSSFGQQYFSFPTSNALWNVLLIYGGMDTPPDTTLLRYSVSGDITINEINYSIIYKETGDTITPEKDTLGFIREENKVIYYIGKNFLDEYLSDEIILYDFSKSTGDTIIHFPYMDYFYSVIENIDSVLINNVYRKRFKIFTQNNLFIDEEYWIEGIGSIKNGLLGHITSYPICCYHYWEHICFTENGEILYRNPEYESCYPYNLLNSIAFEQTFNESIEIYPNPVKNELTISGLEYKKGLEIEIINQLGQIIYSEKVNNQNQIKLNIDFPGGLYIVRIKNSNKKTIASSRLVK